MHITISPEQVALMRALVVPINCAHLDAECEPPGFTIAITFLGPYGNYAVGQCGQQTVDLGEVSVDPCQGGWALSDDGN
jgi:hypothetical protein